MGLKRENIETEQITKIAEEVFIKSRNYGFRNTLGGGISTDAIKNINYFIDRDLIDKFETRKVIFDAKKTRPIIR